MYFNQILFTLGPEKVKSDFKFIYCTFISIVVQRICEKACFVVIMKFFVDLTSLSCPDEK